MDAKATFNLLVSGGFAAVVEDGTLYVSPEDGLTDRMVELIRANRDGLVRLLSSDRPSWRWLVTYPDGTVIDHTITPHATRAEMQRAYSGAVELRPLFNTTSSLEAAS